MIYVVDNDKRSNTDDSNIFELSNSGWWLVLLVKMGKFWGREPLGRKNLNAVLNTLRY